MKIEPRCPWCNAPGVLEKRKTFPAGDRTYYRVACNGDGCPVHPVTEWREYQNLAIKEWSLRSPQYQMNLTRKDKSQYKRVLQIARKMHTWIFLHTADEQAVYDEIGLTDQENAMLGYGGKIVLDGSEDE